MGRPVDFGWQGVVENARSLRWPGHSAANVRRVASAATQAGARGFPLGGHGQGDRFGGHPVATVSCVRIRTLRRSNPVRCGDVEILRFGAGFELHPVERASSVGFGRPGRYVGSLDPRVGVEA